MWTPRMLANIYLHPLDKAVARIGWEVTRYAGDLLIQCRNEGEARMALRRLQQEMANLGLTLHPDKTRVVHAHRQGFDFLGYHLEGKSRRPRDKSLASFKHSRKKTFPPLDAWIRVRLRTILKRRQKKRGIGKESRMREIRPSGSEGGGAGPKSRSPYPYPCAC